MVDVHVVFRFSRIEGVDSPEADSLADLITSHTTRWKEVLGADVVWVDEMLGGDNEVRQP